MIRRIGTSKFEIADLVSVMLDAEILPYMAKEHQTFMGVLHWVDALRSGTALAFVAYRGEHPVGAIWGDILHDGTFFVHLGFQRGEPACEYANTVIAELKGMSFVTRITTVFPKEFVAVRRLAKRVGMQEYNGAEIPTSKTAMLMEFE